METCDDCGREYPWHARHVAVMPRPSDPSELVAVLAFCPPCGRKGSHPTPATLEREIEAGKHPGIAFLTA